MVPSNFGPNRNGTSTVTYPETFDHPVNSTALVRDCAQNLHNLVNLSLDGTTRVWFRSEHYYDSYSFWTVSGNCDNRKVPQRTSSASYTMVSKIDTDLRNHVVMVPSDFGSILNGTMRITTFEPFLVAMTTRRFFYVALLPVM